MSVDESNDKVWKGYVRAKLEEIHADLAFLRNGNKDQTTAISNNSKDISSLKAKVTLLITLTILILGGLLGIAYKVIGVGG